MRHLLAASDAAPGRAFARWVFGCALAAALACGADEAPPASPAMSGADVPVSAPAETFEARTGADAADTVAAPVPLPPSPALRPAAPLGTAATPEEPAPETGAAPVADAKPLTDLLRLPAATPVDRATERAADRLKVQPPNAPADGEKTESADSRLKVEYESRKDEVEIMKRARTRTDAGVSVETGEGTRVKTGVRVEQEEGLERESPVPTVGIEKRF